MPRRVLALVGMARIVIASSSSLAGATDHIAAIDDVMVAYDRGAAGRFVEI